MGTFSTALSGLQADTVALNTIGNNLANLNTTAFKEQGTTFEDLFYQQIGTSGANDPLQVGVGTKVSGTPISFLPGTVLPTGNATDVSLDGDGFFVVQRGGAQSLTRAGNFQLSQTGEMNTVNGEQVMGYGTNNGTVNQNGGLIPLVIPVGTTEDAQATQGFSITANLNAGAAVGTQFTTPLTVFDSLGTSHALTVTYTKAGSNTWNYAIAMPAGDASGTPVNNMGTLTFNSSGQLVSPSGSVTGIQFPGLVDGANDLNFVWNLSNGSGSTISQSNSASTMTGGYQDGFASGVYQKFSVDTSGVITATFSNGHKTTVGQIAVATVTNMQGLAMAGNNNFITTASSGTPNIGVAGTGGRGTIEDAALEQSNVDISSEFSRLIVAQRAFEANSKTITTLDSLTQATIGMIR